MNKEEMFTTAAAVGREHNYGWRGFDFVASIAKVEPSRVTVTLEVPGLIECNVELGVSAQFGVLWPSSLAWIKPPVRKAIEDMVAGLGVSDGR